MGKSEQSVAAIPADLRCHVVRTGQAAVALLWFRPAKAEVLTQAEREVALAVAQGLSNAAIARARGAALRTIANQIAAIMKKLGVTSRVELAARFTVAELT